MKLVKRVAIIVILIALLAPVWPTALVRAQGPSVSTFTGFLPTPYFDPADGKSLCITTSGSYETLQREPIYAFITSSSAQLQWGIFDPDVGGHWDPGTPGNMGSIAYKLYADPGKTGDATGKTLVGAWTFNEASPYDNAWWTISMAQSAAAVNGTQYIYLLEIAQQVPTAVSKEHFKLGALGTLELIPKGMIGIEAGYYGAWDHLGYDGEWALKFTVEAPPVGQLLQEVTFWDGDFDFGDIGTRAYATAADTDDPDTPAPKPVWATASDTKDEGAQGAGMPPENTNGKFFRGAAVTYEAIDPNGVSYLDSNPSGNREWEAFRIRSNSYPGGCQVGVNADHCVAAATLPPGVWTVKIHGLDLANLVFFRVEYTWTGVPVAYQIAGYKYQDCDADGEFDPGTYEMALPGVKVNLKNGANQIIATTYTGLGGSYRFENLTAGTYTVEEINPAGLISTKAVVGSTGGTVNNLDWDHIWNIPIPSGDQVSSINNNFFDRQVGGCNLGSGTPGYWKNHLEVWPVQVLTVGGYTYTQEEVIHWFNVKVTGGDNCLQMFYHLAAAKLAWLTATDYCGLQNVETQADIWMYQYCGGAEGLPNPLRVPMKNWVGGGLNLYNQLTAYNNGQLCVGHR